MIFFMAPSDANCSWRAISYCAWSPTKMNRIEASLTIYSTCCRLEVEYIGTGVARLVNAAKSVISISGRFWLKIAILSSSFMPIISKARAMRFTRWLSSFHEIEYHLPVS